MNIRVHCVGGPAHGEDRIVDSGAGDYFRVAEQRMLTISDRLPDLLPKYEECRMHVYRIVFVGRDKFVGVHQD